MPDRHTRRKRPALRSLVTLLLTLLVAAPALAARPAASQETPPSIVEPNDGRDPVFAFIASARSTLDVAIYELSDRRTLTALESAATRGVRVRVLAEPLPGGRAANAPGLAHLQTAGVQVRDSSPSFRLTHEKAIVSDRSAALIMTFNLIAASFSGSRELAFVDAYPDDVAEVEAVFEADWDRRPYFPAQPNLVWSPDNARAKILQFFASATVSVDCYAEELTDQDVVEALTRAALRGIHVRLLMTDRGSRDAGRARRAQVQAAGGEVRLLAKPFVHAKAILVDGERLFAGSENLTAASLDQNRELGIITSEPTLLLRISLIFDEDWQNAAAN